MAGGTDQRDGRSMASPRRSARAGSGSTRGPGSTTRTASVSDPDAPPPVSAARRLGVLVVVAALAASVLLAVGGGSIGPDAPPLTPTPTVTPRATATPASAEPVGPPPAVAPVVAPPTAEVVTHREWTAQVTIPDPGVAWRTLELRIYRNDRLVMEGIRVRGPTMSVRRVPLRRGTNRVTAALANAGGEGPRSAEVVVDVDDQPPRIDLRGPDPGEVVNASIATVRGVTDPETPVTIRNPSVGAVQDVVSDERGVFIVQLRLGPGQNRIEVEAEDPAGNRSRRVVSVTRGEGVAAARLTISRQEIRLAELPASVNVRLELTGPGGWPVDGAEVTFSISPPGLATETYHTVAADGVARWDDVVIPRQGTGKGNGFVTALAVLGDGIAPVTATEWFEVK